MLVVFDFDGVLVSTKRSHFQALNHAIERVAGVQFVISELDHLRFYDGLPTREKLKILSEKENLPEKTHEEILTLKQIITEERILNDASVAPYAKYIFARLQDRGITAVVCSNCTDRTVKKVLDAFGIYPDGIYTPGKDLKPKPSAEMFMAAMRDFSETPSSTVIFEDSPVGISAAKKTGAFVSMIRQPDDLTMQAVDGAIREMLHSRERYERTYRSSTLDILIPMAGRGQRFQDAGYNVPKPLVPVFGIPMIIRAIRDLDVSGNFIFVVSEEHAELLSPLLLSHYPSCKIAVQPSGKRDGAACSALLARDFINPDHSLLIANCDQAIRWNPNETLYRWQSLFDGGILTFKADGDKKWSYARVNDALVQEVAEKQPISDRATCGVYWWSRAGDFISSAERMIASGKRVNGEFYIAPTFNEMIADGKRIGHEPAEAMHGIGTPEDLEAFLNSEDSF